MCNRSPPSQPLLSSLLIVGGLCAAGGLGPVVLVRGRGVGSERHQGLAGRSRDGFLLDDGFTASATTLDKKDTGWKGYAGYRFNRLFAAEAGYADLGSASFNTTIVAAPPGRRRRRLFDPRHGQGTRRVLVCARPLAGHAGLSLFARAGVFRSDAKFTEVITDTGITRVSRTDRRSDANYGVGLQWRFTGTVGARLEWERFKNIGRGIGGREGRDVDFASAGLVLQFAEARGHRGAPAQDAMMLRPILASLALVALALGASAAPPPKTLHVAFDAAETGFDPPQIGDLYSTRIAAHIFESLVQSTTWRGQSRSSP